jgi:CRISPR-associated protein Cas2
MLYLICYDISNDKIRNRVSKYLGAFGNRIQKSVFEVDLKNKKALVYLQDKLDGWLEEGDDLRFYQLCINCRKSSFDRHHHRIGKLPSLVIV